jgi:dUTP pyrophosphatase
MASQDIIVEPLFADVECPFQATKGSAGYDLRAHLRGRSIAVATGLGIQERSIEADTLQIAPGERVVIPFGFRAALPPGLEAQIRLRSSFAFRTGLMIPNAPGTIDSDFREEWRVVVLNGSSHPQVLAHRERFAQVVLGVIPTVRWVVGSVPDDSTRSGGMGSTGDR